MKAYLQFGGAALGLPGGPFLTQEVPHKITESPYNYSRTGYGRRMPTEHMVYWESRWRRVYCCCYSNASTLYIKGNKDKLESDWLAIVDIDR